MRRDEMRDLRLARLRLSPFSPFVVARARCALESIATSFHSSSEQRSTASTHSSYPSVGLPSPLSAEPSPCESR